MKNKKFYIWIVFIEAFKVFLSDATISNMLHYSNSKLLQFWVSNKHVAMRYYREFTLRKCRPSLD